VRFAGATAGAAVTVFAAAAFVAFTAFAALAGLVFFAFLAAFGERRPPVAIDVVRIGAAPAVAPANRTPPSRRVPGSLADR
jgi:hypothetical protein